MSSSASSTEEYFPGAHVNVADLSEFLSSIPGIHLYNQWSLGAISSTYVQRKHGSGVLEAFEAQKLFFESQKEGWEHRVLFHERRCVKLVGRLPVLGFAC